MQIIEVVTPASLEDDVLRLAKRNEVSDVWISGQRDNQSVIKNPAQQRKIAESDGSAAGADVGQNNFRVLVYPLELSLPNDSTKKPVSPANRCTTSCRRKASWTGTT